MSKTVRNRNTKTVCKRGVPMEDQLTEVKQTLAIKTQDIVNAQTFAENFKFEKFEVDTSFPNGFSESVEMYVARNIKNYQVVIADIKEMIIALADPTTDRPLMNEFNWVLLALDHTVEIKDSLFSDLNIDQKNSILNKMLEESEIRLTMFQSIPVSLTIPESQIMNNATTTSATSTNNDKISDVIEKAVKAGEEACTRPAPEIIDKGIKKALEEAAKADFDVKTDPEIQRLLKVIAEATASMKEAENNAKKTKTEEATAILAKALTSAAQAKPKSKFWTYASIAAASTALVGAGVYFYCKSGMTISVVDAAGEQVVGG